MRVLVDECAPRALKKHLLDHGHDCRTAQEAGWSGKQNGELLSLAEAAFDVLVTVDTNLLYQQNLADRRIAIVVLKIGWNTLGSTFQRFYWPLRESSPGKLFKLELMSETFDAEANSQGAVLDG